MTADQMMDRKDRHNNGNFWTPTIWVDYAHKMITSALGEDWKEKYVVWDCCCGGGNLTKDYRFNDLFCSTLLPSEIEITKETNPDANIFQFDFLNDCDDKIPESLLQKLQNNSPLVFFINPPYGEANPKGGIEANTIISTRLGKQMKKDGINGCEYVRQFLYRIAQIKTTFHLSNIYVCCFTNPSWLLKPNSHSFRDMWFNNFHFLKGIMFNAGEFPGCSNTWGITFNIWKNGMQENINLFPHILLENRDGQIVGIGGKNLQNNDNRETLTTVEYVTAPLDGQTRWEHDVIVCADTKKMQFAKRKVSVYDHYCGRLTCNGNDVQQNNICSISNTYHKDGNRINITNANFVEACVVLTIKKLVQANWINQKDQYNLLVDIPDQFKYDCLVYAAFQNYCMSYRMKQERLKNEFCWMSKIEMEMLAKEHSNPECYADVKNDIHSTMYDLLSSYYDKMSVEAQVTLLGGRDLVYQSFPYREVFNEKHPEYQINNWDAGWYQIKALCKEYIPNQLHEFQAQYKTFSDQLRVLIYEIGLLPK